VALSYSMALITPFDARVYVIFGVKKKIGARIPNSLTALYDHNELCGRGDDTNNQFIGFVDAFAFSNGESVGLVLEYMDMGSLQVLVDSGGCDDEKNYRS